MRIVKEAEERKNEILDVAGRLFGEQGYDATSTNDILKEIWHCQEVRFTIISNPKKKFWMQ